MTNETIKGILFNVKSSLRSISSDAIKAELQKVVEELDTLEGRIK